MSLENSTPETHVETSPSALITPPPMPAALSGAMAEQDDESASRKPPKTLRSRVLAFVGALILLALLASTISLYQITSVNRTLENINRVAMPASRLFAQMQIDAEVFQRELNRGLGSIHWNDSHWTPRPVPKWITEVIDAEVEKARTLLQASPVDQLDWIAWVEELSMNFGRLQQRADALYRALEKKDRDTAARLYPEWTEAMEAWSKQLQWGMNTHETGLRESFQKAQAQVTQLRTGLEMILIAVVGFSFLLLWLGERALRPLNDLTRLAREITRRGLRREDKERLPDLMLSRTDEVSQLAREFHRMATQLLEREKVVEIQKKNLEDQNQLLSEMAKLNETVLNSMRSVLLVTNLRGEITRANAVALRWLSGGAYGKVSEAVAASVSSFAPKVISSKLLSWPVIQEILGQDVNLRAEKQIPAKTVAGRIYGGQIFPLQDRDQVVGAVLVLDDLTDEVHLQERLRNAENLAAMGRLSAQVAHEVRNPLHSIGLEAEVALDQASKLGNPDLKQALQSILAGVDRLEKITENYLKLSKMTKEALSPVPLFERLQTVLATYASQCEKAKVRVDWRVDQGPPIFILIDPLLLEQVIGNLLQNAIQALGETAQPRVSFRVGRMESGRAYLQIADNGPGIRMDVLSKLFQPFVTTKAQGTGLGLSFVKKVAEDHGGEVRYLESHRLGGACFELLFPEFVTAERAGAVERIGTAERAGAVERAGDARHLSQGRKDASSVRERVTREVTS